VSYGEGDPAPYLGAFDALQTMHWIRFKPARLLARGVLEMTCYIEVQDADGDRAYTIMTALNAYFRGE
jgi:hypothetical protein